MTDFQLSGKCKYFDGCSAPVCPRDTGAAHTAWFVGEPICRLRDVPEWVKRQRKIKRGTFAASAARLRNAKTGARETTGCFTLPMLERRCVIGKKMTGIDPVGTGAERKNSEKIWLDKHPPVKPKTGAERERLSARMRLLRGNPS
jgi:hypothetical protein